MRVLIYVGKMEINGESFKFPLAKTYRTEIINHFNITNKKIFKQKLNGKLIVEFFWYNSVDESTQISLLELIFM